MFATGGELDGASITTDAITDGFIEITGFTGSDSNIYTLVQVDFDPTDDAIANSPFSKGVVLLQGVDSSTIDASDFIF